MNCTSLTQIVQPTESSFKDLTLVMFRGSGIQSIPDKIFLNCSKITSFEEAFSDCTNLQTIGDYAFAGCSSVESFKMLFSNLDSLEKVGNYAFYNCTNVTSFTGTFSICDKLTTIGEGIFDGCDNVESFKGTFGDCSKLDGNAPELWLRVPDGEENGYIGISDGYGLRNSLPCF